MIWIWLLGIESTSKLPKVTPICSRHFGEKDFDYVLAGRRNLKGGADPVDSCPFQYEQEYPSKHHDACEIVSCETVAAAEKTVHAASDHQNAALPHLFGTKNGKV
nr:unnamed protein product [Callosobruchus analis]